jgi:hypothetical protein
MKTYSIALQRKSTCFTNWNQYNSPDDINWDEVENFCKEGGYTAYGYYYGNNSRDLTATRCRTILKEFA